MKQIIMLCILLNCIVFGYAQKITVQDYSTKKPLEFVTIVGVKSNSLINTNELGVGDISILKGEEKIEIRLLGYESKQFSYVQLANLSSAIELEQSIFNLNQVVISATKWKQSKGKIPEKITTISKKDVQIQNPQTAADLLEVSGEVFIQKSQQGGGSPIIRGFSTNRLLYSVDGVRMNTAIFRSGNIQNVISLDPYAIENTEVLFGPGSIIYGSDAIGGVMSFQTLTPKFSNSDTLLISGNVNSRFSSANKEETYHFDVNVGGEQWASVTSFSNNNFGDLEMGSNGPNDYLRPFYVKRIDSVDIVQENEDDKIQTPSGYSQINLMQKLAFRPNENWSFEYGFHFSETSDYDRYDRHIRLNDGAPRYGEWKYGPQKWLMNNLQVNHLKSNSSYDEMTLRLAQQQFEESRISRDFNDAIRETRIEKVDAYSLNLDFRKKIKLHELFYGIETVFNKVDSEGINENILTGAQEEGASRYPNSTWASYAVYVNDVYQFSEKTNFQAGLRYNIVSLNSEFDTDFYNLPFTKADLTNDAITGSIGLVHRPSDSWVLSTNLSTAFRAPNVDDVGKVFDSEPGSVVVPNPSLSAEYAYNLDLGVAKVINNTVKIDLTAYYTQLENALVRRDFQLNGMDSIIYDGELSQVQAIQNAAKTYVYGVQAGVEIKLPSFFSFSAHANFQKGEEELDNGDKSPSRHIAPFFGNAKLQFERRKLTMQLSAIYNGEISYENLNVEEIGKAYLYAADDNGNPYSPRWYTLNFKSRVAVNSSFSLSAGVENITDQRYRPYSSGIAGAGRNYVIGLNAKF